MTEDQIVDIIYTFVTEKQFPKSCPNCGRVFHTLREYVEQTEPVGKPVSYDAEFGEWEPEQPIGTLAMATCPCGSTQSISSKGMPIATLLKLMVWAKMESLKRSVSLSELLNEIRIKVDEKALKEQ